MTKVKFYLLNACYTDEATFHTREPVGIYTTQEKVEAAKLKYNQVCDPRDQVNSAAHSNSYWEVIEIEPDKMLIKK